MQRRHDIAGIETVGGAVSEVTQPLFPAGVRRWVLVATGVVTLAALYGLAVRGPAILFDLAGAIASICF